MMTSRLRAIFTFPHPVNEYAARMVAGMVVLLTVASIAWEPGLIFFLTYGFLARVLSGPSLSPMGLLATRILAPALHLHKSVAGPPKRFAQMIGLVFSAGALMLHYGFDYAIAAQAVLGVLAFFALLESVVGFCTGCFVFRHLMRWGIIPADVCEKCNDLSYLSPSGQSTS